MNTWLSWRPSTGLSVALRAALRLGTRVSHHLFSVVGACAVVIGLALWMLPNARGLLAAKLMPAIVAAVQAGPERLLTGYPLPPVGPASASGSGSGNDDSLALTSAPSIDPTSYDGAFDGSGMAGVADAGAADAASPSRFAFLAKMMSSQHVAADARDDRVLVSAHEQELVTSYLSRRYHVAPEPVGDLVKAAFRTGREVGLDPLLLLAVMAIESGFNPYAESGVGAKGLMQVMSKVHSDKFQYFGGQNAALQPLANITVGAVVLKDCIARGGSLAGGLRLYVGSTSQDDGGYGAKVMAERGRLRDVARGRSVSITVPQAPQPAPAKQVVAASKRVQVALNSPHPAATSVSVKGTDSGSAAPTDDSASAPRHGAATTAAELGA